MGPRPFGRGMRLAVHVLVLVLAGFNGAATFRSRNDWTDESGQAHSVASMGPRPFGRGMPTMSSSWTRRTRASMGPRPFGRGMMRTVGERVANPTLQWGRDLSVAECCTWVRAPARRTRASMGPRPFGRGMILLRKRDRAGRAASMGPRPFGRGMMKPSVMRRSPL